MMGFLLTFLLIAIVFYRLFKNKSIVLCFGILFFIELFWTQISCAYLDLGGKYISETGQTSYSTGSIFRLLLLSLPFLLVISSKKGACVDNAYFVRVRFIKVEMRTLLFLLQLFTFAVVFYGFLDMMVSGIPLFSPEITRINYRQFSKLPFAFSMLGEVTFFGMFCCGYAFFHEKSKVSKIISIAILVFSLFCRILMEYKWHGIYNVVFVFFIPGIIVFLEKRNYKVLSIKNTVLLLLFVFSFFGIFLFVYSLTTSVSSSSLLLDRIFALQAHTFWKLDDILVSSQQFFGSPINFLNELYAVFHGLGDMDINSGAINIMYTVAHPITVEAELANGVRFASSYMMVGINTVGYLGVFLFGIVLAFLALFTFKMMYSSIKNKEFVVLYLAQSLFWDVFDFFRIGNYCELLNIKTILVFTALCLIYLYKRRTYEFKKDCLIYENRFSNVGII